MVKFNPPWKGPPLSPEAYHISGYCFNLAFFVSMVYEEAVKLHCDLLHDRTEQAGLRAQTIYDLLPQIRALRAGTTEDEKLRMVTALGEVDKYLREGDATLATDAADRFISEARMALLNTVVRCEKSRW